MKPLPLILVLAVATSGCASPSATKLPVCDGKHRRPANPYGSVLDPAAPASANVAASPSPPAPAPPAADPKGCGA